MNKNCAIVKLFYALTFGSYGLIVGFLVSLLLLFIVPAAFWIYLFKSNADFSWVQEVFAPLFILTVCILAGIGGTFRGHFYGKRLLENEPDVKNGISKALKRVSLAALSVFLLSIFLRLESATEQYIEVVHSEKEKQKMLAASLEKIKDIILSQEGDQMIIEVKVAGKSVPKYQLTVRLISNGYVKAPLMEYQEIVPLDYDRQAFKFAVPFTQLSQAYRDKLINYIPVLIKRFEIDEYLQIEAALKPLAVSSSDNLKPNIFEEKKSVLAQFMFSCQGDICQIIQEDKKRPADEEFQPGLNK